MIKHRLARTKGGKRKRKKEKRGGWEKEEQKKPSRYQQTASIGYLLLFTNKKLYSQKLQPEFRPKTHVYAHDMRQGLCARQAEGL